MATWIVMLFTNMLIPAILIGFGSLFKNSTPVSINALFGYRTRRSTKNQETWEFANKLWGKMAWKWGIWTLIDTIAAMIAVFPASDDVIANVGMIVMFLQLGVILLTIPVVENALKKEFDENGIRRR